MVGSKRKFRIEINEAWCKGCELCVKFCPHQVLIMEGNKAKVDRPEACTGCQLCEIYCPDFAVEVNRLEPDKGDEKQKG
jgi:NAD-dependent dihydropyrimidine dehydrogenase PreA subunit